MSLSGAPLYSILPCVLIVSGKLLQQAAAAAAANRAISVLCPVFTCDVLCNDGQEVDRRESMNS